MFRVVGRARAVAVARATRRVLMASMLMAWKRAGGGTGPGVG